MNAIPTLAAVIVAAGRGNRMSQGANQRISQVKSPLAAVPKAYLPLAGKPVIAHSLLSLAALNGMGTLVVVYHPDDHDLASPLQALDARVRLVQGGATRTDSVAAGLKALRDVQPDLVLIHDAARPLLRPALLDRLLTTLHDYPDLDGVCPATVITDALKRVDDADHPIEGVARDGLRAVQTPQVFRYAKLLPLYQDNQRPSVEDDMAVAAAGGLRLRLVAGDGDNIKITYAGDVKRVEQLLTDGQSRMYRVGQGVDVHGWADDSGRPLRLGGLTIPSARGLAGHSDADVLLHALMDAILGALALGDIGQHFPSDDQRWAGADSTDLLAHVLDLMSKRGGLLVNIDLTVVGESPKISPHRQVLQANIAALTHLPPDAVSVKATTTDRLGFLGRGEGLACLALIGLTLPHE